MAEKARKVRTSYYGVDAEKEHLNSNFADNTPFDPNAMAAASYDYPLGTVLKVSNPESGITRHVIVRDRGPNKRLKDRQLDLTVGAYNALGLDMDKGLGDVVIEPAESPYAKMLGSNIEDWQRKAMNNANVITWYRQMVEAHPELKNISLLSFMNAGIDNEVYNYKKAIESDEFPSYQPEHKQYRWSDIGKLEKNPNLDNKR